MVKLGKKPTAGTKDDGTETIEFINLSEYDFGTGKSSYSKSLKVVEVDKPEHVKKAVSMVYDGSIVILDTSNAPSDSISASRLSDEISALHEKLQVAKLGTRYFVIVPEDIHLERKKVRYDL